MLVIACVVLSFAVTTVSADVCTEWYTVSPADYCYKIWTDRGITEAVLKAANPGLNCDALQSGQKLCLKLSSKPLVCEKYQLVQSGDYCYKIYTDANLSERQFKEMNPQLNCDSLQINQAICVRGSINGIAAVVPATGISTTTTTAAKKTSKAKQSKAKRNKLCTESHKVQSGDTCFAIQQAFGINSTFFGLLNPNVNCNGLKIGQELCIDNFGFCPRRHTVVTGNTCYDLQLMYSLGQGEIVTLNSDIDCKRLSIGRRVCVGGIPERQCSLEHIVATGDTCWSISMKYGTSVDELMFMNPKMKCETLLPNFKLCVAAVNSTRCAEFYSVDPAESCEDLRANHRLTSAELHRLNPTLDCNKLSQTRQVCIGEGYFKSGACSKSVRIGAQDSCTTVASTNNVTLDSLKKMNNGLNCAVVKVGQLVCVQDFGGFDQGSVIELLLKKIGTLVPALPLAFETYKISPNDANNRRVYELLTASILDPKVYSNIRDLYDQSPDFRKILDAQSASVDRSAMCASLAQTKFSQNLRLCICGNSYLLLYCHALMSMELSAALGDRRQKRSDKISPPKLGCSFEIKKRNSIGGCFGGGCSIPVGIFSLGVSAEFCTPTVSFAQDVYKMCTDENELVCNTAKKGEAIGYTALLKMTVGGKISLCIPLMDMLEIIGLSGCWNIAVASFVPVVSTLDVQTELNIAFVSFSMGARIKAGDMAIPDMCELEEFNCEDYCLWRHYKDPDGTSYFVATVSTSLFGLKGPSKTWKEGYPRKPGCNVGDDAAILIRNDRTCLKKVSVYCASGDDKIGTQSLDNNGDVYEFAFRPRIDGRTLYFCEFTPSNGPKIGFDVYSNEAELSGPENFYYRIENDGVYYQDKESNPKERRLMKAFQNKCSENEDADTSDDATGKSTVPAASCGKRVVGYYTAWGKREVSIAQLKKLTHVIFAFIATKADGSLSFDGVAQHTENGENAGKKAERRFDDMRTVGADSQ